MIYTYLAEINLRMCFKVKQICSLIGYILLYLISFLPLFSVNHEKQVNRICRKKHGMEQQKKGPHIQRHFCTAYSPKMNSCLVVWSCRTMRRISGKWALVWHCTHALWRGGGAGVCVWGGGSACLSAFKFTQTLQE